MVLNLFFAANLTEVSLEKHKKQKQNNNNNNKEKKEVAHFCL